MAKEPEALLPVTLELGGSLAALATAGGRELIKGQLGIDLQHVLERWGIPGRPVVEIRAGATRRAVSLRVHGQIQPVTPELMHYVWSASAPSVEWDFQVSQKRANGQGFPDEWLQEFVAGHASAADTPEARFILEYVRSLALAVIEAHPACLVGSSEAQNYLDSLQAVDPGTEIKVDAARVLRLLTFLLDLGVSLANRAEIARALRFGQAIGRRDEDTDEALFARLRSSRVEILVHPHYLKRLFPETAPRTVDMGQVEDWLTAVGRELNDEIYRDLGVYLPQLAWIATAAVPQECLVIKINDLISPWLSVLQPVENVGHSELSSVAYLKTILYGVVSPLVHCLVSIEDVEYRLAELKQIYPEIVELLLARFALSDITRLLRALARESVSSRDLRLVVERLLHFEIVAIDTQDHLIFDERLAVPETTPSAVINSWPYYLAYVRAGMRDALTFKYAGERQVLAVLEIDTNWEARISMRVRESGLADGQPLLAESEQRALRDAIWTEFRRTARDGVVPVLLTRSDMRPVIAQLGRQELPGLAVLARQELRPGMRVHQLGTITPSLS